MSLSSSSLSSSLSSSSSISFLIVGDYGKAGVHSIPIVEAIAPIRITDNFSNQLLIAKAMIHHAEQYPQQFVISVGDNFYPRGVTSAADPLWKSVWTDVFLQSSALKIPWYAVLGNHDYEAGEAGVQAQIDRHSLHQTDDFWRMEATNYSAHFCPKTSSGFPSCNPHLEVVFIDTIIFTPRENACCDGTSEQAKERQAALVQTQLVNIEKMLQAAVAKKPTWLLVVGHYPIFSVGDHGDIAELKKKLLPLLKKYKVQAYICGDDHLSEHLQFDGIDFFVVGAGSMVGKVVQKKTEGELLYVLAGYSAFATVVATANEFTLSFVDDKNTKQYTYSIPSTSWQLQLRSNYHHHVGVGTSSSQEVNDYFQRWLMLSTVVVCVLLLWKWYSRSIKTTLKA